MEPVTALELSRRAAALAADAARSLPDEPEPGRARRWALIHRDDEWEAWVIAWPAGTGLGMHDHDGSAAGIHVVSGRLRERYVTPGRVVQRWWQAGDRHDLAPDHIHEVRNVDGVEAVTIHAYAPPLGDLRFGDDEVLALVGS